MSEKRKTAGEISKKLLSDTTKYDSREVGHFMTEDIEKHLYIAANNYKEMIDEDEYCVVMVIGKDPLIRNLKRRKFYCWPFLPKPRPNQSVFLYNKRLDKITKRLWVLPSDMVMAELASLSCVDKRYKTMQAWSIAFFKGTFWEYIRYEHGIKLQSETEALADKRKEMTKCGINGSDSDLSEPFDFSKIHIKNFVDPSKTVVA